MGNKTKYSVGDLVLVNKTKEVGTVIKIDTMFGTDYSVYIVKIGDFERLYDEKYLSLYRDNKVINKVKKLNVNDVTYSIEIDTMIDNLIKELKLTKGSSDKTVLKNACKLVRYFSMRNKDEDVKALKSNNLKLSELIKGFSSDNDEVAITYLFSEILTRLDIDAKCVILKDQDEQFHVANIVLIDDLYYYFDLSIERSIYIDNKDNSFVFCCSGIGSENYEKFFKPLCLLSLNNESDKVPKNISNNDIDFRLLNKMMKISD